MSANFYAVARLLGCLAMLPAAYSYAVLLPSIMNPYSFVYAASLPMKMLMFWSDFMTAFQNAPRAFPTHMLISHMANALWILNAATNNLAWLIIKDIAILLYCLTVGPFLGSANCIFRFVLGSMEFGRRLRLAPNFNNENTVIYVSSELTNCGWKP